MLEARLGVKAIAWTAFEPPEQIPWVPLQQRPDHDYYEGQDLVEFAGRACYRSWDRPNPKTADNAGYIRHILEVGHYSVLEHGSVTLWITGVSRSLTHELVRHRHLSFSQESQRYVPSGDLGVVVPSLFKDTEIALALIEHANGAVTEAYELLAKLAEQILEERGVPAGTQRRKEARQAARAVLPNMTETRIVVTGNYRAWRHFIDLRATKYADVEIRNLAIKVLAEMRRVAPHVFADYVTTVLEDGSQVAYSPGAKPS